MVKYKSYDTESYHKKKTKIVTKEKALDKAMYYCSRAEHCTHEVKEKLSAWGLNEEESINQIIEKLKKETFIDDSRFASSYIREKMTYNRWGKIKIAMYLRMKRIEESIYSPMLQNFENDIYIENLEYILNKKWPSIKGKNDYERKQKLIRFASGRGYELDIVVEHVEKMAL